MHRHTSSPRWRERPMTTHASSSPKATSNRGRTASASILLQPNMEWWYFDSLLDDGAKLAVSFCTKDGSGAHQGLEPLIEIDLDLPDGRRLMKYGRFKAADFQASKDGCDVRIGEYRFAGDLHEYTITGAAEDVSAEVRLEGMTEPWRPETGHVVFGDEGEDILAWLIVRAHGQGDGHLPDRLGGPRDHGHRLSRPQLDEPALLEDGAPDRSLVLGTGHVGPYSFVTAYITAAEKYGLATVPLYMLARDGKVIADDGAKVAFSKRGGEIDEHTGKPVPDSICFDYRDGDTRYVLTYSREKTLVSQKNLDLATGLQKVVAEIIRYPGGYLRFSGPVSLDRYQGDEVVEHLRGDRVLRAVLLRTRDPRRAVAAERPTIATDRSDAERAPDLLRLSWIFEGAVTLSARPDGDPRPAEHGPEQRQHRQRPSAALPKPGSAVDDRARDQQRREDEPVPMRPTERSTAPHPQVEQRRLHVELAALHQGQHAVGAARQADRRPGRSSSPRRGRSGTSTCPRRTRAWTRTARSRSTG